MELKALARRAWFEVRGPRPPACPPGWSTGAPDFIGVGVQRAGTTWWHHLVTEHPRVHRGRDKELHFLRGYHRKELTAADVVEYHRYFARPPAQLAGEWSPGYMSHFWVPPLLDRVAPQARILVLLRDPVERYLSGAALQGETRRTTAATASMAFRLGCYALQLEQLFDNVDRERVLVLQYERCVAEPGVELARTYRFLGVDHEFVPEALRERRNAARGTKPPLADGLRRTLARAYEHEVARTKALVPDLDLSRWPSFAHLG
jgi:hypothetical protein